MLAIEHGQMEGPYFTQWRIELLEELIHGVVFHYGDEPLVTVTDVKIWYDRARDFHMLSYESAGNHVEVQLYKVFSSKINGVTGWQGCLKWNLSAFSNHLREHGGL